MPINEILLRECKAFGDGGSHVILRKGDTGKKCYCILTHTEMSFVEIEKQLEEINQRMKNIEENTKRWGDDHNIREVKGVTSSGQLVFGRKKKMQSAD